MSSSPLGGTEGLGEATAAFDAAMDAESPSRSKQDEGERQAPRRQDIEDIFPRRRMDRSEREGGANEVPEEVRQRRAEARARGQGVDEDADAEDDPRRAPYEDREGQDEEGTPPEQDEEDYEEPEDEEEPDEPEAAEADPNAVYRINVDGEPIEVTLDEMARGY